ncbi:MAG: Transcriptional regulatory protein tctD [Paracidovorax wautersii]|uniref:Transcriptional regulatory protein tctD n=1 Tax=Paracidovorax wautersii TaxID=1177982 RepID=A0A7V8JQR7_9BURK|nr:MAG: Transcriptional regulatory protein tctD [Paracidovorax wautersii]
MGPLSKVNRQMKVLLVEDDLDLSQALARVLTRRGVQVVHCADGMRALDRLATEAFDVVMLDLGLPVVDGLQLLLRIRARGLTVPVLIVTARSAVGDKVAGLNAGADDYLAKPFDLDELEARLRALCRRAGKGMDEPRCGSLRLDRSSGACYLGNDPLELTPRESALITVLMERPGQAVTKDRLTATVFPSGQPTQPEAVEVVVHPLRKKLAQTDVQITTLRGLGYLIQESRGPRPG